MKTALVLLLVALIVVVWGGDRIGMEGERTVYTVKCEGGAFEGNSCTGKLVPADRYRFRTLKKRGEVLFWVVGSSEPSGKYTGCTIEDRGNWQCKASGANPPTIAYEMVDGVPMPGRDPPTPSFHAVRKWKWYLLRMGVPLRSADA